MRERKRLTKLDNLKAVGSPFTFAEEVQLYLDKEELSERKKQKRLKKEVQFARQSTTTLPSLDALFKIQVKLPYKKRRDKNSEEFYHMVLTGRWQFQTWSKGRSSPSRRVLSTMSLAYYAVQKTKSCDKANIVIAKMTDLFDKWRDHKLQRIFARLIQAERLQDRLAIAGVLDKIDLMDAKWMMAWHNWLTMANQAEVYILSPSNNINAYREKNQASRRHQILCVLCFVLIL